MIETTQYATGKRKYAIARAWIEPGPGDIQVNNRPVGQYFSRQAHQIQVHSPFDITGTSGQIQRSSYAVRWGHYWASWCPTTCHRQGFESSQSNIKRALKKTRAFDS